MIHGFTLPPLSTGGGPRDAVAQGPYWCEEGFCSLRSARMGSDHAEEVPARVLVTDRDVPQDEERAHRVDGHVGFDGRDDTMPTYHRSRRTG
jgi:hypothetical protein